MPSKPTKPSMKGLKGGSPVARMTSGSKPTAKKSAPKASAPKRGKKY